MICLLSNISCNNLSLAALPYVEEKFITYFIRLLAPMEETNL